MARALAQGIRAYLAAGPGRPLRYGLAHTTLDRDAQDKLWVPGSLDFEVGFVDAGGTAWIGVDDGGHVPVALELASLGYLDPGDGGQAVSVFRLEQAKTFVPSATAGPAAFTRLDL